MDFGIKVKRVENPRNAVVVQIIDGREVVSIECQDESLMPRLEDMARRVLAQPLSL